DLVIRGGMNIAPAEVEGLLSAHPKIAESAVVGQPDEVLGERVCVFVVPRPGQTVTLDEVVAFLRDQRIASYKLPERLEAVAEHSSVEDDGSGTSLVDLALAEFGRLDAVITSAGVDQGATFHQTALAEFRDIVDIDLLGTDAFADLVAAAIR